MAQSGRSTGPTIPPAARIRYAPQTLSGLKFSCIYVESTHERVALALEQQLRSIGVELTLIPLSTDEGLARLNSGNFEAALIDVANGPLVRPYLLVALGGSEQSRSLRQQGGRRRAGHHPARRRRCRVSGRRRGVSGRHRRRSAGNFSGVERAGQGGEHAVSGPRRARPRHPDHSALVAACRRYPDRRLSLTWRGSESAASVGQFALILALAAVVPLVAYGLVSIISLQRGTRESVVAGNQNVATRAAEEIRRYVSGHAEILKALASRAPGHRPRAVAAGPRSSGTTSCSSASSAN